MITDSLVLTAERLRDDVARLRSDIRSRYKSPTSQVRALDIQEQAARLAEIWLVEIGGNKSVRSQIESGILADRNVHFQRLLTYSEAATQRKLYESEIKAILKDYSLNIVIPLKQARGLDPSPLVSQEPNADHAESDGSTLKAFIGQSFGEDDASVNFMVKSLLESLGVEVLTGERPKADRISNKVKGRIDLCDLFLGIFSRRDKIARKPIWTTSAWVIDEKAYAFGKGKRLVLLVERGVESIGGLQGDYEYIEFNKDSLDQLLLSLLQLFRIRNTKLL